MKKKDAAVSAIKDEFGDWVDVPSRERNWATNHTPLCLIMNDKRGTGYCPCKEEGQ